MLNLSKSITRRLTIERIFTFCVFAGALASIALAFFFADTPIPNLLHQAFYLLGVGALIVALVMSCMSEFKRIKHAKQMAQAPVMAPEAIRQGDLGTAFFDKAEEGLRGIEASRKFMRTAFLYLIIGVCAIVYGLGSAYRQEMRRAEPLPETNGQATLSHHHKAMSAYAAVPPIAANDRDSFIAAPASFQTRLFL